MMPGVNEMSNAVAPTQWPQMQQMAYVPQQSATQLLHSSQAGVPTSSAGEGGNPISNESRQQPSVATHAFQHYQNGSSHTHIPHQLVLVPQPQNFAYLPHSGGHLPLTAYHQAAGLHGVPTGAGFAPLQPAVGNTSTGSPTPGAASQQSQQAPSQESSTSAFTKPMQQVQQQSAVKMVAESPSTVVTSDHAQVVQTLTTNQTSTGSVQQQQQQQQAMPMLPHVVPQMQPQYQPTLQAMQQMPQQIGMAPSTMIAGHQQQPQHVQLPMAGVMHTTAAQQSNAELNDRGMPSSSMDSSSMNQSQPQAASNIQPQSVQQQLSTTSQLPSSN